MPTINLNFKAFFTAGLDESREARDSSALREAIVRAASEARWWEDEAGMRFSLTKAEVVAGDFIVAVLAQQHFLGRHLYDDAKRESRSELDSYEDRIVIFDLGERRAIIEWRQFRQKPPLSLPLMVRRLERILSDLSHQVGLTTDVRLLPFEEHTSKGEFVALFYANRIIEVEVTGFAEEPVPEGVTLVNPIPPLEGALRDLLSHDLQLNTIDRMSAQARDNTDSDLKRASVARAMVHSGHPTMIRYESPGGYIRVRRENETGIVQVFVPIAGDDSAEDRAMITDRVLSALGAIDLAQPPQLPPAGTASTRVTDNLDLFDEQQ